MGHQQLHSGHHPFQRERQVGLQHLSLMNVSNDDLHFATAAGHISEVNTLLAQGHDPNAFDELGHTPLHYAAQHGHLTLIQVLLRAGANVNAHSESKISDSPLGHVAGNCTLAVAQALIAAGADPTQPGWMQICALDRAKERKKEEGRKVYALLLHAASKFARP